jgi:sugar lactone lactonase YvrE
MKVKKMKKNKQLLALSLFIILSSCTAPLTSVDFTREGGFTDGIEGPATDESGNIYAVNYQEQGTIGKVTPEGKSTLFVSLPDGSIGNGIRFGTKHQMFVADYTNHNVLEIDLQSKKIEVFAHSPQANQPNDLAIAPNQTLYASDPNWSDNTGNLWKVTRDGGFELLEANMGTTNGIEVSHDGRKLYVNESVQRKIWVYDILFNGSINNKTLFHTFQDFGLDGMRFHQNGNLFVCRYGKGTVAILSPQGDLLKEIQLKGQNPTNITFSPDYRKCYVTVADRGCLEMVDL